MPGVESLCSSEGKSRTACLSRHLRFSETNPGMAMTIPGQGHSCGQLPPILCESQASFQVATFSLHKHPFGYLYNIPYQVLFLLLQINLWFLCP